MCISPTSKGIAWKDETASETCKKEIVTLCVSAETPLHTSLSVSLFVGYTEASVFVICVCFLWIDCLSVCHHILK